MWKDVGKPLTRAVVARLAESAELVGLVGGAERIGPMRVDGAGDGAASAGHDGHDGHDGRRCADGPEALAVAEMSQTWSAPDLGSVRVAVRGVRRWHSATFDGQEHDVRISGRARSAAEVEALRRTVIAVLHDCDLPLPGQALIDMRFERAETHDPVAGAYAWSVDFFALTVND
ncbi:tail completion protein gp17 [Rhodothalassium salexigens]|uniref:tail completion protein gp17 n=1 Tax=Rhodothalassium salexigens TaxID=1086 RepID=UPI001911F171|nr:hypothetical protein [Rhodothalassium salexigens]